ncbi:UNVERIFIED_CONTAM: hypothetical protein GTU68_063295 [Idotea baltica]|nr:hypothetical protein [Idotea baltica]
MKVDVLGKNGQPTGRSVELDDAIFGIEPNEHAVYLSVKGFLAAQRQGTAKSKERGEVKGSRRKIKRQKGTGTARAGDIKNPIFRGGGRMFGPKPRNYEVKLNKKVKKLARYSALTSKVQAENGVVVLEDLSFDAPKTKQYKEILSNLNLNGKKTLLVLDGNNKEVFLSARNVPNASVTDVANMNTYEILKANTLIITESAAKAIQ